MVPINIADGRILKKPRHRAGAGVFLLPKHLYDTMLTMCERQQGGLVVNGSFIGALRRQYPEEVSAIIHHVMHDHPEGQAFMKSGQEDEDGIADEESTRIYSTVLFPHYAALKRGELEFEILDRYPYLGIVQPVSPASESPKV